MFEYTCEVCGKVKQVKCRSDIGRFCSKKCYGFGRANGYVQNITQSEEPCKFNPDGVICDTKNCKECGWNPDVAKARLENYMAHL